MMLKTINFLILADDNDLSLCFTEHERQIVKHFILIFVTQPCKEGCGFVGPQRG